LGLTLTVVACGNTTDNSGKLGGASGSGGVAAAGGSGAAGRDNHAAGSGGTASGEAGTKNSEAGAGGDAGANGAEAGAAGAPAAVVSCEPGGALFVAGNYANAAGDELLLRSTPSAATLALVPKAPAAPAKPPELFAVERVCAPGGALIVRDTSSRYRVDFSQVYDQILVCISSPVATLDLASNLPPADLAHASDTGCAGKPFSVYTAEGL
jgi:hypothetical protein